MRELVALNDAMEEGGGGADPDALALCLRDSKAALKRAEKQRKNAREAAANSGKSGRPRMDEEKRAAIKADYKRGTLAAMAEKHQCGADTIRRIWLEVEAEQSAEKS